MCLENQMVEPTAERQYHFRSRAKRGLFLILAFSFLTGFLASHAWASKAQVTFVHSRDRYEAGNQYPILFQISVEKGWYLHSTEEDEKGMMIPTKFSFEGPEGIKVNDVAFPPPELVKFEYTDKPIQTFSGQIPVHASLIISEDTPQGEYTLRGVLSYQACSVSTCQPPDEASVSLPVTVVPKGIPAASLNRDPPLLYGGKGQGGLPAGLWLSLIGFFLGGLALNLTPCIYPLIPITVSYFGGKARSGSTFFQASLYLVGLAMTNSLLGLWAALSGRLLGSVLQNPVVVLLMAFLFLFLALSFFGLWELRLPSWLVRGASKTYGGYFGALFMGLTLGIVAAPCLGPFILGLLTYVAQLGNPWAGFLCFFVLSLGLGLPLATLAFFSGAVDRLPMSGDWMVWIRKVMGWILVAMAVYMVRPLIPLDWGKTAFTARVPIGACVHLCWIDRCGQGSRRFVFFKKAFGIFLVVVALVYLGVATQAGPAVTWVPYEKTRLDQALRGGKPLIFDAYADWCVPCRTMDIKIFKDPDVVKLSRKAVMMRLDLTKRNPSHEAIIKRYGIKGVPTILFFNSDGIEMRDLRAEYYLDREEFLARFRKVLQGAG
jgi:thiol:disulfide interchange protein DsbD